MANLGGVMAVGLKSRSGRTQPFAYIFLMVYLCEFALLAFFIKGYRHDIGTAASSEETCAPPNGEFRVLRIIQDFQIGFSEAEIARLSTAVLEESHHYGFDPMLLLSVIITESSLRKGDVSYLGAHGLMQIKPAVANSLAKREGIDWKGRTTLLDPESNVRLGCLYLSELTQKFGDVKRALIAYNLGETEMRRRLMTNRKLPSQYFRKVMNRYASLLETYPDD